MKPIRNLVAASLLVGASAFVAPAHAFSLLGDTISSSGFLVSPNNAVVGAGVEFTGINGYMKFDFDANTLTVSSQNGLSGWSGWSSYVFGNFDQTITSFALVSNSGFNADFISNYSFTANTITLDMNSGSVNDYQVGGTAVFAINGVAPIPEPETYAMMLAGLGLLGIAARRRKLRASA